MGTQSSCIKMILQRALSGDLKGMVMLANDFDKQISMIGGGFEQKTQENVL